MDFNYIIKRIIIGTGIALAVWFIKDTCFAATKVSQYQYRVIYNDAACIHLPDDYICTDYPGSTTKTTAFTSFGTAFTGDDYNISGYYVRMGTSTTASEQFQSGMNCTTTFTINYNPRDKETSSTQEWIPTFNYFNGTDYVPMSGSYTVSKAQDDFGYNVTFNYQPPAQSRYIYVQLDLPSKIGRDSSEAVNFRNGKTVCATSSTDNAIIDGTSQIVGSVEGVGSEVNHNLKDIHGLLQSFITKFDSSVVGDGTSPGSVGGSLDPYSSSGLEQKEGQIDWTVDDNAFDLDLTPFTGPMQFIWVQVNTFIGLDPLFMSAILVMLTLTFVALVVGRL